MTPDRFWQLVGQLVVGCRWPDEIAGSDTMNWVAAAVVAGGRAAYEGVRARGEIDPAQWQWDEAEALLVVGYEEDQVHVPPADHGGPVPPVAVTLQWLSIPSPEGVHTPDDDSPELQVDLGDHPSNGRVPVHDPEWVEAQRQLAADPSFVARRVTTSDGPGLVLVVPVSHFTDPRSRVDGYVTAVHQLLDAAEG